MNKQIFRLLLSALIMLFLSAQAMGRYEFNGPNLRDVWIWDDPVKAGKYSLEEKPGSLSIHCEPPEVGENHIVWDTRGTAPMMLMKAPEGDYSVETYIKMRKFSINGYAGIQVIGSEGIGNPDFPSPWGHFVIEKRATQPKNTCRVKWSFGIGGNPKDDFEFPIDIEQDEAYLKLVKKGTKWDCYFREADAKWELIGTGKLDLGEEYYIGFVVGKRRWGGFGEVIADFDYFRSPLFPVEPKLLYITTFAKIKAGQ